jgi:hypothetical protein
MATSETALRSRARRAYDLGRLRWSLRLLPFVAAAAGLALLCGRPLELSCLLSAPLLVLAVGLSFAGGTGARAVAPGLTAGVFALVLPLAVGTVGHACLGPSCMSLCLPACIGGGALSGAFLAFRAAREEQSARYLVAGFALAGLMGSLGCTMGGAAGVVGMLAGALGLGGPVLLASRAR